MTIQPPSPPYLGPAAHTSGSGNKPIERIVIHCTVSACATGARDIAAYFRSPKAGGSAHYVVDAHEAVQVVFDSVIAWHAPPNSHSLGVELCCTLANQGKGHWERADHQAMLHQTAKLVAQLCLAYDVPMMKLAPDELRAGKRGLCGHVDVSQAFHESTHWDPGSFFPWGAFLRMVRAEAKKLTVAPAPTVPTTIPDTPAGPSFTAAHFSGKWDADDKSWRAAFASVAKAGASVATMTETTIDGLLERVTPDGWAASRLDGKHGESECSIAWDADKWTPASEPYATKLATTQFYTSRGRLRPPVTAVTQPLLHLKHDRVLLATALHAPSGVEGKRGLAGTTNRRQAHLEATAALHVAWAQGRVKHPTASRLVAGDFNLSFRLPWVRDWWDEEFPGLASCWQGREPKRGTHGDRVIDWVAVGDKRLTVTEADVLATVPGFDHRPLVARVRWLA